MYRSVLENFLASVHCLFLNAPSLLRQWTVNQIQVVVLKYTGLQLSSCMHCGFVYSILRLTGFKYQNRRCLHLILISSFIGATVTRFLPAAVTISCPLVIHLKNSQNGYPVKQPATLNYISSLMSSYKNFDWHDVLARVCVKLSTNPTISQNRCSWQFTIQRKQH